MQRPIPNEYPSFYASYIERVPETDIVAALRSQIEVIRSVAAGISSEQEQFAYAPGKWSIRQVAGHLGDGERVFSYRALRFSRMDQTPLPGFDENKFVDHSRFNDTPLVDLVEELAAMRAANVKMFASLDEHRWSATGVANGNLISVRALAYIMVGHVRHHLVVLRDRYAVESVV